MFWQELDSLGNADLWEDFFGLRSCVNRLPLYFSRQHGAGYPAINASFNSEQVCLTMQVPGVNPDALEILVKDDTVTVEGEFEQPTFANKEKSIHRERSTGKFQRTVTLPFSIAATEVEAKVKQGILTLVLPRAEISKPKKITVKY